MEDFIIPAVTSVILAILLYFVIIDLLFDLWATRVIVSPWAYKVQKRVIVYSYISAYTTTFFLWLGLTIYAFSLFK